MSWVFYNANPAGLHTDDCVIRAISTIQNDSWDNTFYELCRQGAEMHDMPDKNKVWSKYLMDKGYTRHHVPFSCPGCFSIIAFCEYFNRGRFIVATGEHVVAVIDGDYYDTWDSGDEVPQFYWTKGAR